MGIVRHEKEQEDMEDSHAVRQISGPRSVKAAVSPGSPSVDTAHTLPLGRGPALAASH
jgi:hypothetical protein